MKYVIAITSLFASLAAAAPAVVVPAPPNLITPGVVTVTVPGPAPVVETIAEHVPNVPAVAGACPTDAFAVLFEQSNFAGIKHWLDGNTGGDCRGLNGTNIRSIQYVSKLGGDPVTEKINSNVKLTFFNDFGCAGSVMGATQGNQASLSGIDGAKSVKITCGNEGSGAVSEPCDDKPVVETIVPVVIESEVPCDDETVVETIVPESTHGIPPVVATGNPDPAVPCDKNETIVATTDPSYGAVPATITTIEPNYGASGDAAQAFAQDVNALPVGADPNAAKGATAVSENPKSSAAGLTVSMAGGITAFVMSLML